MTMSLNSHWSSLNWQHCKKLMLSAIYLGAMNECSTKRQEMEWSNCNLITQKIRNVFIRTAPVECQEIYYQLKPLM